MGADLYLRQECKDRAGKAHDSQNLHKEAKDCKALYAGLCKEDKRHTDDDRKKNQGQQIYQKRQGLLPADQTRHKTADGNCDNATKQAEEKLI